MAFSDATNVFIYILLKNKVCLLCSEMPFEISGALGSFAHPFTFCLSYLLMGVISSFVSFVSCAHCFTKSTGPTPEIYMRTNHMSNLWLILFFMRSLSAAAQQQCSLYTCAWLTYCRSPSSPSGAAMAHLLPPCKDFHVHPLTALQVVL